MSIPTRITFDPPEENDPDPQMPLRREKRTRKFRITPPMLGEYGYTDGCEGCRWQKAGLTGHRGHSDACRARIEAAMTGDEQGRRILEAQAEQEAKWLESEMMQAMGEEVVDDLGDTTMNQEDPTGAQEDPTGAATEAVVGVGVVGVDEDIVAEDDSNSGMIMRISAEGSHEGKMRREMKKMNEALQVDIAEVFSPPRVTQEGRNWGFRLI